MPFIRNLESNDHRDADIFRKKYLKLLTGEFFYKKPIKDLEVKSLLNPWEIMSDDLDMSRAYSEIPLQKTLLMMEEVKTFEDICSICYAHFNDLSFVLTLPECKHTFHFNCIMMWVKNKPNCPCCRMNLLTYYEEQRKR